MSGSVVVGEAQFGPGHAVGRVKHPETEPRFEQALHGAIEVVVGKQAIPQCEGKRAEFGAAAQVRSCLYGESSSLVKGKDETVALMEVADGPAIGDDVTFEAPFIAQRVKKHVIGTGRFAAQ